MENSILPPSRWWKRLPVRFNLRTLMILVLLAGCGLGWKANRARDQSQAVEVIKANRGSLAYDFQETGDDVLNPKVINLSKQPPAPGWLRRAIGDEYFQEVSEVDIRTDVPRETLMAIAKFDHLVYLTLLLDGSKVDTAALERIAEIPSLQSVSLAQESVNDAVLAKLAGARRLRRLFLGGASDVTDAGMAPLALLPDLKSLEILVAPKLTGHGLKNLGPRLAGLETLTMNRTGITDESMDFLRDCRKLKSLALMGVKYGDAGLAHLRHLDSLTNLSVCSTEVTDEGLQALSGLRNLRTLNLMETKVTGRGLAHLSGLDDLETLNLMETPMTDEGLDEVFKLKGLKHLHLEWTKLSPQAIAKLQAARPALRIHTN